MNLNIAAKVLFPLYIYYVKLIWCPLLSTGFSSTCIVNKFLLLLLVYLFWCTLYLFFKQVCLKNKYNVLSYTPQKSAWFACSLASSYFELYNILCPELVHRHCLSNEELSIVGFWASELDRISPIEVKCFGRSCDPWSDYCGLKSWNIWSIYLNSEVENQRYPAIYSQIYISDFWRI